MTPSANTPQARLAASRHALLRQMTRRDSDTTEQDDTGRGNLRDGGGQHGSARSGLWQVFSQAVTSWWRHHPAQVAIDVGRPFLEGYARDKPLQLVGIAAGLGAAAVLIKPWRLVSVTGLALALVKSTRLSSTLLSLLPELSRTASRRHPEQTQSTQKETQ